MQTKAIEILRLGRAYNYNLNPDFKYIALCGSRPAVEFSVTSDQADFNSRLSQMRYTASGQSRAEAIGFFQKLAGEIFAAMKPFSDDDVNAENWLHVPLVLTPKELSQIPFELALTPNAADQRPLLLNPQKRITLTREVRQEAVRRFAWPARPRILYAWANPNETVPFREHQQALINVIKSLVPPMPGSAEPVADLAKMITILPTASLSSIAKEVKAAEKNPYTHIHLLAHGFKKRNEETDVVSFGIVLHDAADEKKACYATGEELATALLGTGSEPPAIVSLMTCDSGNQGNVLSATGSIAHELHNAGIPCIFASQFPLTVPGSIKLVDVLYTQLIAEAADPREALYFTREALYRSDAGNDTHDWASLVAYVHLPDDIGLQLEDVKLKMLIAAMKAAAAWTDHVFSFHHEIAPTKIACVYDDVMQRLNKATAGLLQCVKDGCSTLATPALQAEHFGLLGSGYKRIAEHHFRMAKTVTDEGEKANGFVKADAALKKAIDCYFKGFGVHPSNHWNAMQYLSLKAVTEGTLRTEAAMVAMTQFMAEKTERESNGKNKAWAWGTLVEFYLLQPITGTDVSAGTENGAWQTAKEYVSKILKSQLSDQSKLEVIDSTSRQLERYMTWWPEQYTGSFPAALETMAATLYSDFAAGKAAIQTPAPSANG